VNRYRVAVSERDAGWRVVILDPSGAEVFERACEGEDEARAFASTVEQHVGWLSEERFRRYYRLP
jgi:hypothetical protein